MDIKLSIHAVLYDDLSSSSDDEEGKEVKQVEAADS